MCLVFSVFFFVLCCILCGFACFVLWVEEWLFLVMMKNHDILIENHLLYLYNMVKRDLREQKMSDAHLPKINLLIGLISTDEKTVDIGILSMKTK